jgi:hypothetical protein
VSTKSDSTAKTQNGGSASTAQTTSEATSSDGGTETSAVTTIPGHAARGGSTIDIFLLSAGLVLILSAAFYGRLTEIDLPGGVALKLAATAAKAREAATRALQSRHPNAPPDLVEQAYINTLNILSRNYAAARVLPPDAAFAQAATQAVAQIEPPTAEQTP